jgi:hypothetical protein
VIVSGGDGQHLPRPASHYTRDFTKTKTIKLGGHRIKQRREAQVVSDAGRNCQRSRSPGQVTADRFRFK